MRHHGQRGYKTQTHVRHKRRSDQDAITKTMHAVAGQNGPTTRLRRVVMGVRMAVTQVVVMTRMVVGLSRPMLVVLMPVVPQFGLVQQKEEHQAQQQSQKQIVRLNIALKCLGQQVHKRRSHQRTRCQTQHVLGVARQCAKTQRCRQPHRADTRHQGTCQNCYNIHSYIRLLYEG